jgi:hypothetical protein
VHQTPEKSIDPKYLSLQRESNYLPLNVLNQMMDQNAMVACPPCNVLNPDMVQNPPGSLRTTFSNTVLHP